MEKKLVDLIELVMDRVSFATSEVSAVNGFLKARMYQEGIRTFGRFLDGRRYRKGRY
jgi:hypothetical protein